MRIDLPETATQAEVEAAVDELNADPACTGYIVQLPLPKGLDENAVIGRIDPAKDADGLHPTNLGWLVLGKEAPLPCTPRGIIELLRRHDVPIAGQHVVVVGRGITVGRPMGLLLTRRSENATVTLCHTGTRDLAAEVRRADIVIAAAGVPGIISADMVKPGAALLDVGVSRDENGIVGDVDPAAYEVAGWISPNPGGVGPMTRAMLLANVVETAERLRARDGSPEPRLPALPAAPAGGARRSRDRRRRPVAYGRHRDRGGIRGRRAGPRRRADRPHRHAAGARQGVRRVLDDDARASPSSCSPSSSPANPADPRNDECRTVVDR